MRPRHIIESIMDLLSRSKRFWNRLSGCAFASAILGMLALGVIHASAQGTDQSDGQPAFEVASVKLSVRDSGHGASDPGTLTIRHESIGGLLMWAYGLQHQRFIGPEWLNTVFLDVDAKMPRDWSWEQVPRMLQPLLTERLKLAAHRESRTLPVYELVLGKDGPKMKEVTPTRVRHVNYGPDLQFLQARIPMPEFADFLSERLDQCVVDSTGLKSAYDVDLTWTPDRVGALPDAEEHTVAPPLAASPGPPNIFVAIQKSLGLKLVARRLPVEVLVVDHVERVPTEN